MPIIATFEFNGEAITVVNNHFSSKGGSAPIVGIEQPFEQRQEEVAVNGSLDERQRQSNEVQRFVIEILDGDPTANVVVLGDLNEFEFVSPVFELVTDAGLVNLIETIADEERYSFIFQGNSQQLDHILVSDSLAASVDVDIVHVNVEFAEFPNRASDHEPVVARIEFEPTCGPVVGAIVAPMNGICVGSSVTVETDFSSTCPGEIELDFDPAPGPVYTEHGDYDVTVTATDSEGNAATDTVSFTIDTIAPLVMVDVPAGAILTQGLSFSDVFVASDDDGASGGIVNERVILGQNCVLLDGSTFGDADGLLSDEPIDFRLSDLAPAVDACIADGRILGSRTRVRLTLEATDCGGNVGSDTYIFISSGSGGSREGVVETDAVENDGAPVELQQR